MIERRVNLTPRLLAALDLLSGSRVVADIGCDHGKLTAALLQRGVCSRVIATDISEPSLEKARSLIRYIGLADRVDFRVGDGLSVLRLNECDAITMLGMGGTLMRDILSTCETPLMGAKSVVLQPMRAQDDIREYLYRHGFQITDDRIVADHGRYYQVFRTIFCGMHDRWPESFPAGFFDVGYRSFEDHDPNLRSLCIQQLGQHQKRLKTAVGTDGEAVLEGKILALKQILKQLPEDANDRT